MKLKNVDWATVGKAVWKEYGKDDVAGLSAELAYHFIFALFPFAIFLVALAGFIGNLIGSRQLADQILSGAYGALPPSTADSLRQPLTEVLSAQRGGALSIGAVLALWSASNGVGTVMKAFNRAYGVEETRSYVVKKALAVGMTLVLSLLLISGFILLAFGGQIGQWVADGLGLGALFTTAWNVIRIVGALVGISLALGLLYWKGPNVDQQFRWLTPGSVITTIVWALATVAFGFYVQFLGASSYSKTYGTAFGLILFLLYLYYTSTIILLGAELNAETGKRYDPELIRDKVTDSRKQLPGEQPAPDPRAAREAGVSRRQVTATNASSAAKVQSGKDTAASATLARSAKEGGTTEAPAPGSKDDGSADGSTDGSKERRRGHLRLVHSTPDTNAGDAQRVEIAGAQIKGQGSGEDHTALATAAVSAAAIVGAMVIGALSHRTDSKKAA